MALRIKVFREVQQKARAEREVAAAAGGGRQQMTVGNILLISKAIFINIFNGHHAAKKT